MLGPLLTPPRPPSVRASIVISLALACACAPAPARDATRAPTASAPQAAALFAFHDGAWVNLHHTLYARGLKEKDDPAKVALAADEAALSSLAPAERGPWDAAVAHYARGPSERDLSFDQGLERINAALAGTEDAAGPPAALPPDLSASLAGAMPVYRARLWPAHRRDNEAWIASLRPLLAEHGAGVARELATLYRIDWPSAPVPVDVARYASWGGAYTTIEPPHVNISSLDPGNQGPWALEVLFHETSHTLIFPTKRALAAELGKQGKTARDLWHVVLFFTVGEVVKKRIGPSYVPYADKLGVYDRGWRPMRDAAEKAWRPYVEGKVAFEQAVHDIVAELPSGAGK